MSHTEAPRRHPLASQLHPLHLKKPRMTVEELRAAIDMAQCYVEYWWEQPPPLGFSENMGPFSRPARCAHPGCNYRRYPASRLCMHHSSSNDSFASYLRRRLA
jgi:hypothetical protein